MNIKLLTSVIQQFKIVLDLQQNNLMLIKYMYQNALIDASKYSP